MSCTGITSSPNPSAVGDQVIVTAGTDDSTATTISFYYVAPFGPPSLTPVPSCQGVPVSTVIGDPQGLIYQATCTLTFSAVGAVFLEAITSGAYSYLTSPELSQTVVSSGVAAGPPGRSTPHQSGWWDFKRTEWGGEVRYFVTVTDTAGVHSSDVSQISCWPGQVTGGASGFQLHPAQPTPSWCGASPNDSLIDTVGMNWTAKVDCGYLGLVPFSLLACTLEPPMYNIEWRITLDASGAPTGAFNFYYQQCAGFPVPGVPFAGPCFQS